MNPKTKLQKRICKLSAKLPALTEKQSEWAFLNALDHVGFYSKKTISCMDCGMTFPSSEEHETETCPHCHAKLKVERSRKKKDRQIGYFTIVTKKKGFQVLRHFLVSKDSKAGREAYLHIQEVVQRWLAEDGSFQTLARLKSMFANYREDIWLHCSNLEIRPRDNPDYSLYDEKVYPVRRYIPFIRRNGFKGVFYKTSTFRLLRLILTNSYAETLLKARQHSALEYMASESSYTIEKLWPSIKICIRNRYIIPDFSIWRDYVHLLEEYGKDLHNAKYICPKDLNREHDRLVREKREVRVQQEIERKQLQTANRNYQKEKKNFLGISFSDGAVQVSVLQNIEDFITESMALKHCVYTNKYYSKKDSLVLSAKVKDLRTETIEISLPKLAIIQCRGKNNQNSPYHDQIVKLVKNHMGLIRKAKNQKCRKEHHELQST